MLFFNSFNPKTWLVNPFDSLKHKEVRNWTNRNKFSKYFPYISFDPETGVYTNQDETVGFIFECRPLPGEGEKSEALLTSLIDSLPDNAIISFHLISTSDIGLYLKAYRNLKPGTKSNPLAQKAVDRIVDFLTFGSKKGLPHSLGSVVRNVRLLCAVKVRKKDCRKDTFDISDFVQLTQEALRGIFESVPELVDPEMLLNIYYDILNEDTVPDNCPLWNQNRPISESFLRGDTPVKFKRDEVVVGKNVWRCLTPKNIGVDVSLTGTSHITGSDYGPEDDAKQIPSHYIFTTILVKDPAVNAQLTTKAGFYNKQVKGEDGIIAQTVGEYAAEYIAAFSEIERGRKYHYVMPLLWVYDGSRDKCIRSIKRAEALMKSQGWVPQSETALLKPLFICGFPFGFYHYKGTVESLDRYFIYHSNDAACLLPVISDSQGFGVPHELYLTRRNQIFSFDFFDPTATNRNMIVTGGTGGGKSFTCNDLVFAAQNAGAYIRIMDIGYSYKKRCDMGGGYYIDLGEEEVNLNPFTFIPPGNDSESVDERNNQLEALAALIAVMADASGQAGYTETDYKLIKYGVQYGWEIKDNEAGVDDVFKYLAEFPKWGGEEVQKLCTGSKNMEDDVCIMDFTQRAKKIAFNMHEWTTEGRYGRWFNGPASVDLVHEQVIVLELDKLKRIPSLFRVVSLALMNAMTATLYKLPTDIKKFCLFEELGLILSEDNPLYRSVLNELYRRGRKNNVATCSVFQSPIDLANIGSLGRVMTNNSAFHVYLPSDDYPEAIKSGVLNQDVRTIPYFNSIKGAKPRYMEIGLRTPGGLSVVRVVAESFSYMLNTTDAEETAMITKLTNKFHNEEGLDLVSAKVRALEMMAAKHEERLEKYRQI